MNTKKSQNIAISPSHAKLLADLREKSLLNLGRLMPITKVDFHRSQYWNKLRAN